MQNSNTQKVRLIHPKHRFLTRIKRTHPVLTRTLWQFLKFGLIGWALTVLQYLGYLYLPYAFGLSYASIEWMWPKITLPYGGGKYAWSIIGFEVLYNADGSVKIGGGLGYTLSWIIVYFATQLINFSLQRTITYRSKGNILRQLGWYLLALIFITFASNALNSLWLKAASDIWPDAIYQAVQTLATSGISTVAFFFAFKVIFPEGKPNDEDVKKRILSENRYALLVHHIYQD